MLYLTLRHYEYVTAIGREGSISAAADRLNVSQPALSTGLARIEAHLGYPLFIRARGSAMAVTPQGRAFIQTAETLLAQAARLENPDAPQTPAKTLRLGCFSDLAPFLLARALHALRDALPDVSVTYHSDGFEALISALLKGQLDLALTYDLGMDAGFDRQTLYHAAPVLLVAQDHPLTQQPTVTLDDIAHYPLILSDEGLSAQYMLGLFRQHGLMPRVAHRAQSLELMRSLAAHGEGVGLSYANPPTHKSYDNQPLVTLALSHPSASEAVILARHGTGPADPVTAKAIQVLTETLEADA